MSKSRAGCHHAPPTQEEQSSPEQSRRPHGKLQAQATEPHLLPGQKCRPQKATAFETGPMRRQRGLSKWSAAWPI